MKNKFLLLLIVLCALPACGKQQPWNPDSDESRQKKAVKDLADSNNSRQTADSENLDNNQQKKAVENLADSNNNQQTANSENLADSDNSRQTANSENLADPDNNLPAETLKRVSFEEVKPLFEKHCMLCHGVADPQINWLDQNTAKEYVQNGKLYNRIWELKDDPIKGMPLGNAFGMTEEERQKIVEWIEGESA